jgi:hypothetical protein
MNADYFEPHPLSWERIPPVFRAILQGLENDFENLLKLCCGRAYESPADVPYVYGLEVWDCSYNPQDPSEPPRSAHIGTVHVHHDGFRLGMGVHVPSVKHRVNGEVFVELTDPGAVDKIMRQFQTWHKRTLGTPGLRN